MTTREEAERILRDFGARSDEDIDLAEAALALAALQRPQVDLDRYRDHLATLVREVAAAVKPRRDDLNARLEAMREVLTVGHGYEGDMQTYDDLQNANLMRVIDRRKGLPVTLGILYIHVARAQGWTIAGLNFPGHFLVRIEHAGERAIVDPFERGRVRDVVEMRELLKVTAGNDAELTPGYYAPVGNRAILMRLQNNLKLRHMRAGDIGKAVETVDGMLLFAPEEAALWRESGLLNAHTGNLTAAIGALENFVRLSRDNRLLHQAAMLLQQLKERLN